MTTKDKILEILDNTDRQGIDEVMDWLKGSGFFMAPASTNFHGNYEGGLADHSLNVYTAAMRLRATALSLNPALEADLPEDSVAIAAMIATTTMSSSNVNAFLDFITISPPRNQRRRCSI